MIQILFSKCPQLKFKMFFYLEIFFNSVPLSLKSKKKTILSPIEHPRYYIDCWKTILRSNIISDGSKVVWDLPNFFLSPIEHPRLLPAAHKVVQYLNMSKNRWFSAYWWYVVQKQVCSLDWVPILYRIIQK